MVKNWLGYLRKAEETKCDKATIVLLDTSNSIIEYQYCKETKCPYGKSSESFGYGLYCKGKTIKTNKAQLKMDIDNRDGLD